MKQEVLIGQTDYTVLVLIRDDAGAPATGLTEASIDLAYARVETDNDVTTTDVTPAALAALTDAHTDWGFEVVSDTDHPGVYRLDIADAVFASGAWSAVVTITGSGLDPTSIEFVLIAFNPRDAVRLGLTALPNAAAEASGGLPTLSAAQASNGTIQANVHRWLTGTPNALQSGRVDSFIGAVGSGVIAAASFAAGALDAVWSTATRLLTAGTNIVLAKGVGVTGFNDLSAADVNAEADAAIETYHLDHLLATTYDPASKPGAADALLNELVENDGGVARYTANALEQAPTGGSAPSAADIADAVWDEAKAGHVAAGSFGELAAQVLEDTGTTLQAELDGIQADTEDIQSRIGTPSNLGGGASLSANLSDIEGQTDDIGAAGAGLTALATQASVNDLPTNAELATALAAADDAVLAAIAALNNLSQANVRTALGMASANFDTQLDALPTAAENATAVWAAGTRTLTGTNGVFQIKKNTALANFKFKMVQSADHVTPATGVTITAERSIDAGAFGACANSAVEISAGWYRINLAAADLAGDTIALKFTAATADQRDFAIVTQA